MVRIGFSRQRSALRRVDRTGGIGLSSRSPQWASRPVGGSLVLYSGSDVVAKVVEFRGHPKNERLSARTRDGFGKTLPNVPGMENLCVLH